MNYLKKSLVSVMVVMSILACFIPAIGGTAYAEQTNFGGYYVLAFDNETDYAENAGTVATDVGLSNIKYDADAGAFYGGGNGTSKRFQIKPGNAFKNNYKYVKIVWKTNKMSSPATDKTVELYARDTGYNWYDSKETQKNEGTWVVSTADFSSRNNINTFELDFGKTTKSEWTDLYVKYIAFFETEAGMNAYDRDVISAVIDGNAAEMDNFNKTITYNVPYGTEYNESTEPQLTLTQGTTAVKEENGYQITDYKGSVTHYTYGVNYAVPTSPYIYSFDTKTAYDKNISKVSAGSNKTYNETAKALEVNQGWTNSHLLQLNVSGDKITPSYKFVKIRYRFSVYNTDAPSQQIYLYDSNPDYNKSYAGYVLKNAGPKSASDEWTDLLIEIPQLNYNLKTVYFKYADGANVQRTVQIKYIALFNSYDAAADFDYNSGAIKEFKIGENTGKINHYAKTIECYAPKNLTTAVPDVMLGAGIEAVTSGEIDFSSGSAEYKIKKADGEIVTYTVTLKQSIDNLALKGDAEESDAISSDGWRGYDSGSGVKFTVEEENGNHYILFDATENTSTESKFSYEFNFEKGHKYFWTMDALTDVSTCTGGSGQNIWSSVAGNMWTDGIWRAYSGTYNCTADLNNWTFYPQDSGKKTKVYVDNLKIYDITELAAAEFSLPYQFGIESETAIIDKNMIYDIPGSEVKVTLKDGNVIPSDKVVSYGDGISDGVIALGKNTSNIKAELKDRFDWSIDESGKVSLTAANPWSAEQSTLYKAAYGNDGTLESISAEAVTLNGNSVEINNVSGKKLFIWDNSNLMPLTDSYKVMDKAKIYICGDKTSAAWNDRRNIQGWGYYMPILADTNAEIINKSSDWQYQTAETFVGCTAYEEMKADAKAGDWMIVSFGAKDAEASSIEAYETAVNAMLDYAAKNGLNAAVIIQPDNGNENYVAFADKARECAKKADVLCVDLYSENVSDSYYADGSNLNYAGARYMADKIAEYIKHSDSDLKSYIK